MMRGDAVISPLLQEELQERVSKAGGDVDAVRQQLEAELRELETADIEADTVSARRRDIALVLAEIEYLDEEQHEELQSHESSHTGFVARIRHAFGGNG